MNAAAVTALVADDDIGIRRIVSWVLEIEGFSVVTSHDGASTLAKFDDCKPSVVILDIGMPEPDGVAVCRALREKSRVPILMLTALDGSADAVRALEAGADDYVRKPFDPDELVARVRALLRRAGPDAAAPGRIDAGPLSVDEREMIATLRGKEMALSRTEFRLLAYLARNRNHVLTHDQVLERVWGPGYTDSLNVLRVAMSRLRSKLEGAEGVILETLTGVGYRLKVAEAPARKA